MQERLREAFRVSSLLKREEMPHRFVPFLTSIPGLVYGWQIKLCIALGGGILLELAERVAAFYGRMLTVDSTLVGICLGLFFMDTASGIMRAIKKRNFQTGAFRRSGWKLIEYTFIGTAAALLANGTSHTFLAPVFAFWDEGWMIYVAVTEFVSVLENITGSKEEAVKRIRAILMYLNIKEGKATIEEAIGIETEVKREESADTPLDE